MSKPEWNANDIAVPIWVMGSGVPTEKTLEQMRTADSPVHYLVGTSKGRLTRLQKALLLEPWQEPRPGVQVKLVPQDGEQYVFAQSTDHVTKERAMRRRQLKRLRARLKQVSGMTLTHGGKKASTQFYPARNDTA